MSIPQNGFDESALEEIPYSPDFPDEPSDDELDDGDEEEDDEDEGDEDDYDDDGEFEEEGEEGEEDEPSPKYDLSRQQPPNIVHEAVAQKIVSTKYVELPSGMGHVCELLMENGFLVIGGFVNSTQDHGAEEGKHRAYDRAFKRAAEFELYAAMSADLEKDEL